MILHDPEGVEGSQPVPREEKYKAKNVIDTLVYRGGDAVAGWLFAGLEALALGLSGIAWTAVPVSVGWASVSVWLGRRQEKRAKEAR